MRLLSRSRRGTWALAAAAWLVGYGIIWWDLPVRPRAEWRAGRPCNVVGLLADNRTVVTLDDYDASLSAPRAARFWRDGVAAAPPSVPTAASESARTAVIAPDGESVLVAVQRIHPNHTLSYEFRLVQPGDISGKVLLSTPEQIGIAVTGIALSADGRTLAFAYLANGAWMADVWDCDRPRRLLRVPAGSPMALSPDGRWFAAAGELDPASSREWTITLWDVHSGRRVASDVFPNIYITARFVRDGVLLAGGGGTVVVRDAAADRELARRAVPDGIVVAPDETGVLCATYAADQSRRLGRWEWESGDCRYRDVLLSEPDELLGWPWPSPDGRVIAFDAKRVRPAPDVVHRLRLDAAWVWMVGPGESVRLFGAADARLIGTIPGIQQVTFGRDGRSIATVTVEDRRVIQLWDVPPRKPLAWFASAAGVWALPVAWLARRRTRKLASGVA